MPKNKVSYAAIDNPTQNLPNNIKEKFSLDVCSMKTLNYTPDRAYCVSLISKHKGRDFGPFLFIENLFVSENQDII